MFNLKEKFYLNADANLSCNYIEHLDAVNMCTGHVTIEKYLPKYFDLAGKSVASKNIFLSLLLFSNRSLLGRRIIYPHENRRSF